MKTNAHRMGFTLIELTVAMLAGIILAMTAGTLLISAFVAWRHNSDLVKMHNDASIALIVIGREIRESSMDDISINGVSFASNPTASGNQLSFAANEVRPSAATITASSGNLIGPGGFRMVDGWLQSFTVAFTNSTSLNVSLRLAGPARGGNTTINGTFTPRN